MQHRQSNLLTLLDRLDAYIGTHPKRAFFNPPTSAEEIATAEGAIGAALPTELRAFLARHNGGFINISHVPSDRIPNRIKDAAWNSNTFLTLKEIVKEFAEWANVAPDVYGHVGRWPYLPFCRTEGQETLVLRVPDSDGPAPVLDAWHEMRPSEWRELRPGFAAFLEAYLDGEGRVETIAK